MHPFPISLLSSIFQKRPRFDNTNNTKIDVSVTALKSITTWNENMPLRRKGTFWNSVLFSKLNRTMNDSVTVHLKKYAHGFVVLCFVVVRQSFIMNSHEVFIHIHQGCFAGTGTIVRLPQCQWSKPDGYGKISQCITTTNDNVFTFGVCSKWHDRK